MSRHFAKIAVIDTEYEIDDGGLPNLLCMVVYWLDANLRLVKVVRYWRGEFPTKSPFDDETLVAAYSARAELTCFMQPSPNWKFPKHIFDLHTAYLSVSNVLLPYNPDEVRKRERKRLSDACRAYGITGWENIDKPSIAKAIGEGRWREYGREVVLRYCEEDVKKSVELLRAILRGSGRRFPPARVQHVLHWSNYSAKSVALIQARGMPIDMYLWNLVQENKAAVIQYLLRRFDPSYGTEYPIYSPEGEWSYARFENWLASIGVLAWPRLESGRLDIDGDAFRLMYHVPGIEKLHALRDSLGVIVHAKLPIGHDGRNRPSLFPFCTATGRNAHAKSLFNAHAGMRSFMVFPPDKIGVYLDWRTQEVGVVAAASGDQALMTAYRAGDVYHAFAVACGLTDDHDMKHWKEHNPMMRQRMKSLTLALNYGMSVPSLARGINRHPLIASAIVERHQQKFWRYWQWRDEVLQDAMLSRCIESTFGWPLRLTTSPNKRTIYNYMAQSGGAEMLRSATVRLCEVGLIPSMLVHDGILFELDNEEQIAHAIEIMRTAGRETCGDFTIDVDIAQKLIGGARFCDKRPVAQQMWATIMDALEAVGALPKRAAS